MNMRHFDLAMLGLATILYADLHKLSGWSNASVHATGYGEFGLGLPIESFEQGEKVFVGEVGMIATKQAADVTAGQTGSVCDIGLVQTLALGLALKCDAEKAHKKVASVGCRVAGNFFVGTFARYANVRVLQIRIAGFLTANGHELTRMGADFFTEGNGVNGGQNFNHGDLAVGQHTDGHEWTRIIVMHGAHATHGALGGLSVLVFRFGAMKTRQQIFSFFISTSGNATSESERKDAKRFSAARSFSENRAYNHERERTNLWR
jgi:hypothetical protein